MGNLMWIPAFLPVVMINVVAENVTGENEVFVRSGHAEIDSGYTILTTNSTQVFTEASTKLTTERTSEIAEEVTESVVFIPNEKSVERFDDDYDDKLRIKDIMMLKSIKGLDKAIDVSTEKPQDIIFLSGKNTEYEEVPAKKRNGDLYGTRKSGTEIEERQETQRVKLNCANLDCNNTVNELCGGKLDQNKWKYRLFLNECYFRKVNCNFKFDNNRYVQVSKEKCKNLGVHKMSSYKPRDYPMPEFTEKRDKKSGRRNFPSRRSLMSSNSGLFCSHMCPASCPGDYAPECAVSPDTGQKRVFLNHCQLDLNSCSYGVVWQKRPLADCVGSKKADMRQNRGFMGWMQRIGILDGRGRVIKP